MATEKEVYVDGFVAAVPAKNKAAFLDMAKDAAVFFRKHGALRVVETWGDDVPEGELTSFRKAVDAKPDEVIVFSWVTWPSKAARDAGNEAVMNDPEMIGPEESPFDGRRMIYGGFQVLLDA